MKEYINKRDWAGKDIQLRNDQAATLDNKERCYIAKSIPLRNIEQQKSKCCCGFCNKYVLRYGFTRLMSSCFEYKVVLFLNC